MASNNPSRPENADPPPSDFDHEADEVSLQDLGIFDEPPPIGYHSPASPAQPVQSAALVTNPTTSSQSVALRPAPDLSSYNDEPTYIEIETLPDDDLTGKLACAICYQPYYPEQFTVVSKERLNFEAAVVVCPECLAEMQNEVQRRTAGADLVLGAIWGAVATLIITVLLGWLIWAQRDSINRVWWNWLQAFLAVLPGWFIAKAIFIGVGRKSSIWQQFMGVAFTLLSMLLQYFIVQVAYANFLLEITQPDGHPFVGLNILDALKRLMPSLFQSGIPIVLAIWVTTFLGIATAWFVSAGPRLYTRPFVQPAKVKKSRLAQFRQFINI